MTVKTNGFIAIDRETRKLVRYVSFFFRFRPMAENFFGHEDT